MILTQLRCSTSFLNNDWFKSNIVSSPNCACIVAREDAFHFFFECSKYTDIRRDLLICVNLFRMKIDLALLTRANQHLTYEDNCLIFKEVYKLQEDLNDSSLYKLINNIYPTWPSCPHITLSPLYSRCFSVLFYMCNYTLAPPEGGYIVLPLSVLPSVQDIFRRIFLSNYWWQKSDIWSQPSYIGMPYCGKRFWTRQIPTFCLPT